MITLENITILIDTKLESIINDISIIKRDIIIIKEDLKSIDKILT